MSRGLGTMQRRILDALEPSRALYCRRRSISELAGFLKGRTPEPHTECIPDFCYGWIDHAPPYLHAQVPPWVYDLVLVRRYLEQQEQARWAPCPLTRHSSWDTRFTWAVSQFGQPNREAFGADVARALRTLLARGHLQRCDTIPLLRYIPDPLGRRTHPWIDVYDEERATLFYPHERRVRFVTTPDAAKR